MADRTEEERCETCLYVDGLANTPPQPRFHRYAPRPESGHQKITTDGSYLAETGALWPLVQPDDWCGEYKRSP